MVNLLIMKFFGNGWVTFCHLGEYNGVMNIIARIISTISIQIKTNTLYHFKFKRNKIMIDLADIASGGRFESSQLVDEHNGRDNQRLSWNDRSSGNKGFIGPFTNVCEDGNRYSGIHMHPKWVSNGTIKAWLPWQRLPDRAIFKAGVGFLNGANGTDGVSFQVWEHHNEGGREVWNRLINFQKELNGSMVNVVADLSHLSGQNVGIELRVDAGRSSGRDWAVWVDPLIESRTNGPNGNAWTITPSSLTVRNRNEERRIEGRGDEPYIGGLYFRSIFGKAGTTEVIKLKTLRTLGENVRAGRTIAIPPNANLSATDSGVTWNELGEAFAHGVQIMGYQFVAMEEDKRGKSVVKNKLDELGDKLETALRTHVESNPIGLLNAEATLDNIERDVLGGSGLSGGASFGTHLENAIRWLGRADDLIGQNQLILIGLSEEILRAQLGDDYNPTASVNPIAGLTRRDFNLDFRGSDAHYNIQVRLRNS